MSREYITTNSNIQLDVSTGADYEKLVEEELNEYNSREVTSQLLEGGIHAHKAWEYWYRYLAEKVCRTSLFEEVVGVCNAVSHPRILSLGCGYGGYELHIARNLHEPYELIAIDLNKDLFGAATEEARRENLNIRFDAADLNFVSIQESTFDVIYAHASIHHILNLENLFEQIHKGLKDSGRLVVLDLIGKNRTLFWRENVEFATNVVKEMPARYKDRISDPETVIPPYSHLADQRGMEGIRQEEIEELLLQHFTPEKIFKYGSFMRLICTNEILGQLFDPGIQEDREYLEQLFHLDLEQIEQQKLRPTEMLAVLRK